MTSVCETGRHRIHDVYEAQCPCRAMLDLLANKWAALAIGALEDGPLRFGELRRRLQGVSPKVLTQTLRRLEDHGILTRVVYPAVPLHVEYSLSDLGMSAAVPLGAVRDWVERNIDKASVPSQPKAAEEPGRADPD
jgi:DNA-binding HxlR family transcriptional regulator